jgi:hypothetical protein
MSADLAYLDGLALKLTSTYPDCGDYIAGLLDKYKKTLTVGFPGIGDTPEEVVASFESDVRKYCIRNRTERTG